MGQSSREGFRNLYKFFNEYASTSLLQQLPESTCLNPESIQYFLPHSIYSSSIMSNFVHKVKDAVTGNNHSETKGPNHGSSTMANKQDGQSVHSLYLVLEAHVFQSPMPATMALPPRPTHPTWAQPKAIPLLSMAQPTQVQPPMKPPCLVCTRVETWALALAPTPTDPAWEATAPATSTPDRMIRSWPTSLIPGSTAISVRT